MSRCKQNFICFCTVKVLEINIQIAAGLLRPEGPLIPLFNGISNKAEASLYLSNIDFVTIVRKTNCENVCIGKSPYRQ